MTEEPSFGNTAPKERVETKKCHLIPEFGCRTCIESDRDAWALKTYEAWKKTYIAKFCRRHKKPLKPFTYHFEGGSNGRLIGIAGCDTIFPNGEFLCEDEDDCVVIG